MKTNFLSFEEYKQKKINEEFEASVNKINPYTGNVIRTVGDFNEYKENFNVVKYLDNKGMVNPYTNTEIKTYIEYKKYLELCLLNEYEECKKTFINNSNSIFSNKMAKSNTSTTNKKFSSFILIITSLFSSLLFFWWVLLAVYFLVLWIISNFEIRLSNTHLSLLITIAIYIFLVSYLVLKYDRLEYIDNLKSEITSLNNRLIISDNCYAKLKHAFENDYEEKSINLKKQYIEIGKSLEFEYKEKNKVLESDYKEKIRALEHEYNEKNKALEIDYKEKNKALEIDYKEKKNVLDKKESEVNLTKSYINNIINESSQKYPWLSTIYSDLFYSVDKQVAADLLNKKHPALKASDSVMEIAQEKREFLKRNKMLEYQLLYLEALFPWIEEFKTENPYTAYDNLMLIDSDTSPYSYDSMRNWLSPEEYINLSIVDKYQLALDRYKVKKKSDWEIGIEFERYIGYLYESEGFKVKYHGALMGLEDMGRDLIVEKKDEILIIQCKRWAKSKTIHEKHIFQLYGSVVVEAIKNPTKNYKGVFITTTILSELAKKCAVALNITVKENTPFEDYPLIKCNISKTGEKIYHLPFDQQYDRVDISPKKGEFYAYTIKEAEAKGFRRAFRWTMDK